MVVVGIIVLLVTITIPAIGPMLASNEQAQVSNTLSGLLINAQATANQTATCVGLRIERAFKTDDYKPNPLGLMIDTAGHTPFVLGTTGFSADSAYTGVPFWLDHQQVRFVTLEGRDQVFRQPAFTKVYDLPKNFWLAPDYTFDADRQNYFTSLAENIIKVPTQTNPDDRVPQTLADGGKVAAYSRLETFYILFSAEGELVRRPAGTTIYSDQTQRYLVGADQKTPFIIHPDESARGVFVYDRRQWNELALGDSAGRAALLGQSWPIYINRVAGSAVEEKNK